MKILITITLCLFLSGCDLVNLDPTNQVMIEMRDDIRDLQEQIEDGIDVNIKGVNDGKQ